MTRIGVNLVLVGFLIAGLGGAAYLLPFITPLDTLSIEVFETGVLICWGLGAALIVVGAVVAAAGKVSSRR
jgi:hypothetical protein